ncbi:MAG: STAS-like domain-containing protein [Candidatus Dormibacteria bacterium]
MRYDVSRWSVFLATRDRGRRVREEIERHLGQLDRADNLVVSFAGVEGITVSFGDECVAKLIVARMAGDFVDRGLVIEGMNDDVRETMEAVLSRRKVAAVALAASGEPEVIGDPGWMPATLAAAVELRSFRASDLAERLRLTPQAANNRLKMLVASGAVARERTVPAGGGKEFSYQVVIPVYA